MAEQLPSSEQPPSGTPTGKSKISQDDAKRWLRHIRQAITRAIAEEQGKLDAKRWLRHKRRRRASTLLCVVIAASFVLFGYGQLLTGSKPEPTRTELMPVSATGTNPGTIQTSTPTPPTDQTSAPGTVTPSSNVSGKESGRFISTSSWEHVIHTAILFVSCVAMFAILAWAAVALNREDD